MLGEPHDGVVSFRPAAPAGHEMIVLGRVPIGEIGRVHDHRSLYSTWLRIDLPLVSSHRHMPARDFADARRQAIEKINDWLIATDLRPNGRTS